jgi:ADP-ribosyl-[dinitrogen reductase] hydrolase
MTNSTPFPFSTAQLDRAAGALVGQACGDALGVPYEFAPRLPETEQAVMRGGGLGPYPPGEYSDDTQMAVCIAQVAATGIVLASAEGLDRIATNFQDWLRGGASDVGSQTRQVLSAARAMTGPAGHRLTSAATALHERTGHTAGNGALMRTAAVALATIGRPASVIAHTARAVAGLTHADPLAADSCVLWNSAIDIAVREGRFDIRSGLAQIPTSRRDQWAVWLDEAEAAPPWSFPNNGFTVTALQAAWSAITRTPTGSPYECLHLQDALQAAVHAGTDTDTIAAIAGGLLGARWGLSAIPFQWRRILHGWPSLRCRDLARLGLLSARSGHSDAQGWPAGHTMAYGEPARPVTAHPDDTDVLLGTSNPTGADHADAIVTLCRLGTTDAPRLGVAAQDHLEAWLIDSPDPTENPNRDFVLHDSAQAVHQLRADGKTVLLHCVRGENRTPAVARAYAQLLSRVRHH